MFFGFFCCRKDCVYLFLLIIWSWKFSALGMIFGFSVQVASCFLFWSWEGWIPLWIFFPLRIAEAILARWAQGIHAGGAIEWADCSLCVRLGLWMRLCLHFVFHKMGSIKYLFHKVITVLEFIIYKLKIVYSSDYFSHVSLS